MAFILISSLSLLLFFAYAIKRMICPTRKPNSINRLRKENQFRSRANESYSNFLMLNPDHDIKMESWNNEHELREKADIHRARLNKFGSSRLNGEMLYMDKSGLIYKISSTNTRMYV